MNKSQIGTLIVSPFLGLIWLYQKLISPFLPPSCIYHPSCSHYAQEALAKHGLIKGGLLAVWRLLRCQPFGAGGIDPVPETFAFKLPKKTPKPRP
ncbi:MAG: membrane protein insertion efficiency factor YidD [Candidatus Lambdaproteobacteria bacterium RIFOXYD2_FULL_50_16]|uniref:Putative membrane protein insertion efficiency factor n=1 Tax=Candidatus Lambdaproteobacteria bacterium RIFOXYD2_FULL_50_16 TaxID=1817772 RepID=A0A1F6GBB5_9PROT|nr:MAG: membrane protein insertion efficiency factor YidD [Candidatus Lambdaproteobacteria bacterium RIFOXYD2_FULL_50_16]